MILEAIGMVMIFTFGTVVGHKLTKYWIGSRVALKLTYDDFFVERKYWKEFSFDRLATLETVIEQLRESLADATKKRAEWQTKARSLVGIPQATKKNKKN